MPHVQAVIYQPQEPPLWMKDVAGSVETESLHIERVVLPCATPDEIADWLERRLPKVGALQQICTVIEGEIIALVEIEQILTNASHFMMRIFTEAPTCRCGFHVDTVPPRAPTIGLLRVFNGHRTEYVHPENVTSMRDFYRHLSQRERQVKAMKEAQARGDQVQYDELRAHIASLDKDPGFLRSPEDVRVVPEGAIVAFKHVDARWHWSDHPKALAWIHRSPMEGAPRLVVNITARES